MRFILNKFPDDENFSPDEAEWTPLKEATNLWTVQLQALPFIAVNGALVILLMHAIGISFEISSMKLLISFLIFAPIHELIHALFFPEKLSSQNVYMGFTFKGLAPFAAYIGEMKRNTFVKTLLAPFVIITLLGFLILIVFGSNDLIEHIIFFNAIGSSADCLGVFLILRQVPGNAVVRNKKIRTFWKQ